MIDLSGQDIGRYHILEPLGEGGMAKVYKAFDTHLECEVAVKVIRTDQLAPAMLDRTIKRFEREAKEVAKLSHPNIVRVMDYGEDDGVPYLVMQYLHGGTLKQFLGKQMPYQEAAALLVPIARALEYAHQHKMVHRDVKPANILVTDSGEPMLTDFGIVKMLDVEDGNTLTGTGVGLGTPQYMAPEQWMGNFAAEVDQYSLGVVFYELVTGHKPYNADTPAAVLLKQAADPLPRPSSFVPGLPDEVEQVLLKSLAKNPKDRYPSMGEMASALTRLERGVTVAAEVTTEKTNIVMGPTPEARPDAVSDLDEATVVGPIPPTLKSSDKIVPPINIRSPKAVTKQSKGNIKPWMYWVGGAMVLVVIGLIIVLSNKPVSTPPIDIADPNSMLATTAPVELSKLICQVTDSGGIDDKSFNATAWKGVENAMVNLGVNGKYLESSEVADYEKNFNAFIEQKCDLIIGVGYLLSDATKAAAEAHPDVKFTGIDFSFDPVLSNFVGQEFQTDQAAFLAGYLAAGMTKTGIVGTYGGMPIPPVTIFMDGFARGVGYYNYQHHTNIKVLGWDTHTLEGLMANTFDDQQKGKEIGISLMDEGADIILPVAGPVGIGTAAAVQERGGYLWVIGVDADWSVTQPQYNNFVLTSVLKFMDVSTYDVIKTIVDGTFTGGTYVANIANGGVGIATPNSIVPTDLLNELEQVKADIGAGKIEFNPDYRK